MPDPEYRAVDAVSSTLLKNCYRFCPAVAKAKHDGLTDDDDSPELVTGIATHVGVLQPEQFEERYAIGPDVKLNTNAGKAEWAAFEATHPGKICLRSEPGAAVLGIRQSIWNHPEAKALLQQATETELSLFWIDEATGMRCKARLDILARGIMAMPDLKTCQSAKRERFVYHAFDYGYHIQLCHYWAGCAANQITIEDAPIIACEKKPPYVVEVFNPSPRWFAEGEATRRKMLSVVAACNESGKWPTYHGGIATLPTPDEVYEARRQERREAMAIA
jgi:hypothetical protein